MQNVNEASARLNFHSAMKSAARCAEKAVNQAMQKYANGNVTDEDDITGRLLGNLDAELGYDVGGIRWSSSILRHRKGGAAEEKHSGADIIMHVSLETPVQSYSKAVLIQAKRHEPNDLMTAGEHKKLKDQCQIMLGISPSSFVFDYHRGGIRCCSAMKIIGSSERNLYDACDWTSYRFFLELFRCNIGDPKISSSLAKDLPAPFFIALKGKGDTKRSR